MRGIGHGFGRLLAVALFFVVIAGAFIAGGLAFRHEAYEQIPGVPYIIRLFDPPFFYPAPAQDESKLERTEDASYPFSFIVYGDSREIASGSKTAIIERVVDEQPDFVLHLGDMVYCGNTHQWKIFDLFEGRILHEGIPFYPVLGNHEYRSLTEKYPPDPDEQLQHYFNRFPFLEKRRWYTFTHGPCTFIILDTGTEFTEESHQYQWLKRKLQEESPGYLFVALHYPPYTRSGHGRKAEKRLAELFESNDPAIRKPDIVFAGHVHNYERYRHEAVNYVVSGGGGAPPRLVKRSSKDFYSKEGAAFHFCRITVSESELEFEMMRLDDATGTWSIGDSFVIEKDLS
jgi:predicted phosphodiesterase